MEKFRKLLLVLERVIPLSSIAIDLFNKLKPGKSGKTSCPTCSGVLWEGIQPTDWIDKVKTHSCPEKEKKQELQGNM